MELYYKRLNMFGGSSSFTFSTKYSNYSSTVRETLDFTGKAKGEEIGRYLVGVNFDLTDWLYIGADWSSDYGRSTHDSHTNDAGEEQRELDEDFLNFTGKLGETEITISYVKKNVCATPTYK